MKFYILKRCWWMFWADGMVVWPFVFFRQRNPSGPLIRHEFQHCYQVRERGIWGFYTRYLKLLITHGYRKHPDEVEAYRKQYEPLNAQESNWYLNKRVDL